MTASHASPGCPQVGRVVSFDEERGVGEVEGETGTIGFHCTAIADGSRRIAVGTEVAFATRAAIGGRLEACRVVALRPDEGRDGGRTPA